MFKKIVLIPIFLLFFLFVPSKATAVTVSITNSPSTIGSDSFNLEVKVSGAATGKNYLKVEAYKEGTSNYFGETYNGSDWYSGSDGKQYFSIDVQSGIDWTGQIQGRIGSPNSSDYDGQGSYRLRIRRYTSSGNSGSEDANASSIAVSISIPTNTPTPTVTQSPTNTPTPSNTPTPTKTPTPTSIPTKTPTSTPAPSKAPTITLKEENESSNDSDTLSLASETNDDFFNSETPTITSKPQVLGESTTRFPFLFIALGLIFLVVCGILSYFQFGDKIFIWKKNNL